MIMRRRLTFPHDFLDFHVLCDPDLPFVSEPVVCVPLLKHFFRVFPFSTVRSQFESGPALALYDPLLPEALEIMYPFAKDDPPELL